MRRAFAGPRLFRRQLAHALPLRVELPRLLSRPSSASSKNFTAKSGNNSVTDPVMMFNPLVRRRRWRSAVSTAGAVDGEWLHLERLLRRYFDNELHARIGNDRGGRCSATMRSGVRWPADRIFAIINGIEVFTDGTSEHFRNVGIKTAPQAGTALTVAGYTRINGISDLAEHCADAFKLRVSLTILHRPNVHGTVTPEAGHLLAR